VFSGRSPSDKALWSIDPRCILLDRLSFKRLSTSELKMLADKGIRAVAVMWAMTFISFILVPLRLYTRVYIIEALGIDDHVFNLAWVSYSSKSICRLNAHHVPGVSASIHYLYHNRRRARIRTAHIHLADRLGCSSCVQRNDWTDLCGDRNGYCEAFAGPFFATHCG
jgi:hypothetical protein